MHRPIFLKTTVHVQQNFCEKSLVEASFGTFYAKIGQLFEAQWVFELTMFENWQIAAIKRKCCQFWNSSKCWKTHCAANSWPIGTQKVPKEA